MSSFATQHGQFLDEEQEISDSNFLLSTKQLPRASLVSTVPQQVIGSDIQGAQHSFLDHFRGCLVQSIHHVFQMIKALQVMLEDGPGHWLWHAAAIQIAQECTRA